jgi:transketolase
MTTSMRDRFVRSTVELLESDPNVVLVLAEISVSAFEGLDLSAGVRDRIINVGIREQLMVGVAAGLAKEGFFPIVHTYAPFLVERAYEQIKLDFGHQGFIGVFVSVGASYDAASSGRTHQSPADVVLIRALPDWNIMVPGHADEVDVFMRQAVSSDRCTYIRLSEETNETARIGPSQSMRVDQQGSHEFIVIAVGPTLDPVLRATSGLDLTVLYAPSIRPFDAETLRSFSAKMSCWLSHIWQALLRRQSRRRSATDRTGSWHWGLEIAICENMERLESMPPPMVWMRPACAKASAIFTKRDGEPLRSQKTIATQSG